MIHLHPCRDCGAGRDQDCDESCGSAQATHADQVLAEVDNYEPADR